MRVVALLFAVGCGCEVPIAEGGDHDQRRVIQDAIDRFFHATGDAKICVDRAIIVDHLKRRSSGVYKPATRNVKVREQSRYDPWVVATHELCHAAHVQLDIEIDPELWVFDPPAPSISNSDEPREAWAWTCEAGALSIQLATEETCDGDFGATEVYDHIAELFSVPSPDLAPPVFERHPVGELAFDEEILGLEAYALVDGGIRLTAQTEVLTTTSYISVSGDPLPISPVWMDATLPELPPMWTTVRGTTRGNQSLVLAETTGPTGAGVERVLFVDGSEVTSVGCPLPEEFPLILDDELWYVWLDGRFVRWGKWVADE